VKATKTLAVIGDRSGAERIRRAGLARFPKEKELSQPFTVPQPGRSSPS
jgi:hypothetical protein